MHCGSSVSFAMTYHPLKAKYKYNFCIWRILMSGPSAWYGPWGSRRGRRIHRSSRRSGGRGALWHCQAQSCCLEGEGNDFFNMVFLVALNVLFFKLFPRKFSSKIKKTFGWANGTFIHSSRNLKEYRHCHDYCGYEISREHVDVGCWWSIFECHPSAYRCHSRKLDKSFLPEKFLLRNGTFPHNWFQWPDINVVQDSATSLESVDLNSITFECTLIKLILTVNLFLCDCF